MAKRTEERVRDQKNMEMAMFKRKFWRTIPDNLRAPHMKMWCFEAKTGRESSPELRREHYRHIRNYYLSNSKTFQDGNGNGNFEEINSNDFLDSNWE